MNKAISTTEEASKTLLVASEASLTYEHRTGYLESIERYRAVMLRLEESGLIHQVQRISERSAEMEELLFCHDRDYIETVERDCRSGVPILSTGPKDTEIRPGSWNGALGAVGGAMTAVDWVMTGKAPRAFCVSRPPGHHANAWVGMGGCLFNNVAVAARHAQRRHQVKKIAILDWDVHHGNGTQDLFYEDGSVFFCDVHQSPLYPGTLYPGCGEASQTGVGAGLNTTLNLPLPAGSGRDEVFGALEKHFLPAMEKFQPELLLISAGFDSRNGDPLGGLCLTDQDFADLTRMVMDLATVHGQGRVISVLEGGYNVPGLASAVEAHVGAYVQASES